MSYSVIIIYISPIFSSHPNHFTWMSFMKEGPKHFHRKTILHDLTRSCSDQIPNFQKISKCVYIMFNQFVLIIYPVRSHKKSNAILETSVLNKQSTLLRCEYQEKGEGSRVRLLVDCCKVQLIQKVKHCKPSTSSCGLKMLPTI